MITAVDAPSRGPYPNCGYSGRSHRGSEEIDRARLVPSARLRPGLTGRCRQAADRGSAPGQAWLEGWQQGLQRASRRRERSAHGQGRQQGRRQDAQSLNAIPLQPSASRARACDLRMRQRLGESLRYIAQAAEGRIDFPSPQLAPFLDRLARAAVSPMVFGAYCDLVLALDADDLESAAHRLAEILASGNHPGGPAVIELRDPATAAMSDRYARLVDTDPGMPFRIYPPPAPVAEAARAQIAAAFKLMDAGHPELAAEIRALLREIVLAVGPEDPRAVDFDGASSFMLWGGIVLNARSYPTTLDMVQALAHESGHNLLFGLCTDGSLVGNDDRELYPSPLRH